VCSLSLRYMLTPHALRVRVKELYTINLLAKCYINLCARLFRHSKQCSTTRWLHSTQAEVISKWNMNVIFLLSFGLCPFNQQNSGICHQQKSLPIKQGLQKLLWRPMVSLKVLANGRYRSSSVLMPLWTTPDRDNAEYLIQS